MKIKSLFKNKIIFLSLVASNLIFSSLVFAQTYTIGTLSITECIEIPPCLAVSVPTNIQISNPIFLNTDPEKIPLIYNYPSGQKISIDDARPSGGFNLQLSLSEFQNENNPLVSIPTSDIYVISFNDNSNKNITLDSNIPDASIASQIDPDTSHNPNDAITYSWLLDNFLDMDESWMTNMSGGNMLILDAPLPNHQDIYTMGLAMIIKIPSNPHLSLVEGPYNSTATFTLTAT